MNKLLYSLLAASLFSCAEKESGKPLQVEGVVKNTMAKMIYLEETAPQSRPTIVDSAEVKTGGTFSLETRSAQESLYQLRLQGKTVPFAFFINDVEEVKITADLNNTTQPYTVQNSPATEALLNFDKTTYDKGLRLFTQGSRVDSLRKAGAPDSVINLAYGQVVGIGNELKTAAEQALQNSKSPVLSLYVISAYQNTADNLGIKGFSRTELSELVNNAATKFPDHAALQNIRKSLPSNKATDFTQPDVNGQPVSLSQFKGKYVLVDFWASWCQPCRKDNPNVVRAYNAFKDKNFTVLGVSLDKEKDAWLQAIQQDGLTWTHVSDLKFWENAAAAQYGVQSIPYNVLVDPQGNIVAENLHGEELMQTLGQVLR